MPLVSLPHLCMLDATPPELMRAAAAAGFSGVGVRLKPTMPGEAQHPMLDESPMMRECLSILADTGLKVLDIETFWLRPDTDPSSFRAEFEAAARLGALSLQVVSGDEDVSRMRDRFARMAEMAAPLNLRLEFEYMMISTVTSLGEALATLDHSGASNVGILVDTLHIARCATPVAELRRLEPRHVNVLQLCDAPMAPPAGHEAMLEEARFGRLLPGEGELPLAGYWRALPAGHHVSVEVPLARTRHLPFEARAQTVMEGFRAFCGRNDVPFEFAASAR